jgi:hypothetical protein
MYKRDHAHSRLATCQDIHAYMPHQGSLVGPLKAIGEIFRRGIGGLAQTQNMNIISCTRWKPLRAPNRRLYVWTYACEGTLTVYGGFWVS